MNKQKMLKKKIAKHALIAAAIVSVAGGVYFVSATMMDDSVPKKSQADSALMTDQNEINTLKDQLEKSGVAEKRYSEIQQLRNNMDFSSENEALKDFLRLAKDEYQLSSGLKLSLTAEKIAEAKGTTTGNYDVLEHPGMKLEFSALSDAHVFGFIEAMQKSAPGLIRIDTLSLKRVGDIDSTSLDQIRNGGTPYPISAQIDFNWIGLKEKPKDKEKDKAQKQGEGAS